MVIRMSRFDRDHDTKSIARCVWHAHSIVEDDPILQRKGIMTIADFGNQAITSEYEFTSLLSAFSVDALPIHFACLRCRFFGRAEMVVNLRFFFRASLPLRTRIVLGSPQDMDRAYEDFKLDIASHWLSKEELSPMDGKKDEDRSIEEDIRKRQLFDDEWQKSQASFCDVDSPVALVPNPQDVIMGYSKAVAMAWAGNAMYRRLIQQHTDRYLEEQVSGGHKVLKTFISVEILHTLRDRFKSRFLIRKENDWIVVEDGDLLGRISGALRFSAKQKGEA